MVFYESPNRLLSTLRTMLAVWGERELAVVREATKLFEEVHRGTISSAIERFTAVQPKGEITLVVAGATVAVAEMSSAQIEAALRECLAEGLSRRDAVHRVSVSCGVPKKEVYRLMVEMKGECADEP